MSTVIIGGGGGRAAIDRLQEASTRMSSDQRQRAEQLLQDFIASVAALCDEVGEDED